LIGKIKLDETLYSKSELKSDSFDVSIGIKILFFRISVTIEPGRSLLTVRYHELFDSKSSLQLEVQTFSQNRIG
jgi:hypothetical protein